MFDSTEKVLDIPSSNLSFRVFERYGTTESDLGGIEPLFGRFKVFEDFESMSQQAGIAHHAIRDSRSQFTGITSLSVECGF